MMNNSKKTFLFLIILFSSCANSTLEVAPWNSTPVPVVYSVITPGQAAKVYVNRTYNQTYPVVANPYPEAKVYMCGPDSNWVELPRISPDTTMFEDTQKHLNVEMGKTYTLKVLLKDKIVRAHTTILSTPALITNASCVLTGKTDIRFKFTTDKYDTLFVNKLSIKYSLPGNSDCEYWFTAFSDRIYETKPLGKGSFYADDFYTPKDSTSLMLNLITIDPYYKRYLDAQSISTNTQIYDGNSPVLAIIMNFGGVMPQFSNIQNGVGLFGNYVTDKKRIEIKPLKN